MYRKTSYLRHGSLNIQHICMFQLNQLKHLLYPNKYPFIKLCMQTNRQHLSQFNELQKSLAATQSELL